MWIESRSIAIAGLTLARKSFPREYMPGTAMGTIDDVTEPASFVYVVSLYCGAGYHDLPFETGTSKVVLGVDF